MPKGGGKEAQIREEHGEAGRRKYKFRLYIWRIVIYE